MADDPNHVKDPIAVELGRRGALKRLSKQSPERRSEVARLAGHARQAKRQQDIVDTAVATILALIPWKKLKPIQGDLETYLDRVWARRIPKAYEEILDAGMRGEMIQPYVLLILDKMTRICPALNPDRKLYEDAPDVPLGIDLSALSADTLAAFVPDRSVQGAD